jgi:uncharacterized membrane-anchored protein YitT (DUF2179 family)
MTAVPLIVLIAVNIPIFLFLAWLVFDTKEAAAQTIWETVVAVLQILLVPRIVRVMFDMDDEGALGLFPIAAFFIACIAAVAGEYALLNYLLPSWFPVPS